MAHIRPYRPRDEDAVVHVFRDTAAAVLRAHPDPDVLHVGSFTWCRPYYMLNPDWCWVLDDGHGKAVGYILCAPDTFEFVDRCRKEIVPILSNHGIQPPEASNAASDLPTQLKRDAYKPEIMRQAEFPSLVEQYPAHLHIDILPSHQGQGWGQKLIGTLLDQLRANSVRGVHLGMVHNNDGAGRFYRRLGFQPFEGTNDEGVPGRKGGAIYLVKKVTEVSAI